MRKAKDAFRTISEASDALQTPAHVLRFWESKFTQVKPVKRAGGRRYYRPADIDLLAGIRTLLHDQGMTIRGVQKLLQEKGAQHVAQIAPVMQEEFRDVIELHRPANQGAPHDLFRDETPRREIEETATTGSDRDVPPLPSEAEDETATAEPLVKPDRQMLPDAAEIAPIEPETRPIKAASQEAATTDAHGIAPPDSTAATRAPPPRPSEIAHRLRKTPPPASVRPALAPIIKRTEALLARMRSGS